jgi:hypothetical protein
LAHLTHGQLVRHVGEDFKDREIFELYERAQRARIEKISHDDRNLVTE